MHRFVFALALLALASVGCGGSATSPAASQDEVTNYADQNPAPPTVEVSGQ